MTRFVTVSDLAEQGKVILYYPFLDAERIAFSFVSFDEHLTYLKAMMLFSDHLVIPPTQIISDSRNPLILANLIPFLEAGIITSGIDESDENYRTYVERKLDEDRRRGLSRFNADAVLKDMKILDYMSLGVYRDISEQSSTFRDIIITTIQEPSSSLLPLFDYLDSEQRKRLRIIEKRLATDEVMKSRSILRSYILRTLSQTHFTNALLKIIIQAYNVGGGLGNRAYVPICLDFDELFKGGHINLTIPFRTAYDPRILLQLLGMLGIKASVIRKIKVEDIINIRNEKWYGAFISRYRKVADDYSLARPMEFVSMIKPLFSSDAEKVLRLSGNIKIGAAVFLTLMGWYLSGHFWGGILGALPEIFCRDPGFGRQRSLRSALDHLAARLLGTKVSFALFLRYLDKSERKD